MSGTDLAYRGYQPTRATRCPGRREAKSRSALQVSSPLSAYARYAMPGTDLEYACCCYAVSGTGTGHACYRPTRALCPVRY
eukprot:227667-Rhodomonas_salina.1